MSGVRLQRPLLASEIQRPELRRTDPPRVGAVAEMKRDYLLDETKSRLLQCFTIVP